MDSVAAEASLLLQTLVPCEGTARPDDPTPPVPDLSKFSISCSSVDDLIKARVADDDTEHAFYVVSLRTLATKILQWREHCPRVTPFYAVKCNPDPVMLRVLAAAGVNFDCASQAEMEAVLSFGVAADRILYANPCKQLSHLLFAREHGVALMTADSQSELAKIQKHHPQAKVIIRIAVDDSKSLCQFNKKFGAGRPEWQTLFAAAKSMGLQVVGISFHVGSGCKSADSFYNAVTFANDAATVAENLGFSIQYLDVGGGFPGLDEPGSVSMADIAAHLNRGLDEFFPASRSVKLIAEPGRYYACPCFTLATKVHVSRELPVCIDGSRRFSYYINDGVYGSFNCIIFDHVQPIPRIWDEAAGVDVPLEAVNQPKYASRIFGPTCDSMDCVSEDVALPELPVGQVLVFRNMGAYTIAAASTFNSFPLPRIFYVV